MPDKGAMLEGCVSRCACANVLVLEEMEVMQMT